MWTKQRAITEVEREGSISIAVISAPALSNRETNSKLLLLEHATCNGVSLLF